MAAAAAAVNGKRLARCARISRLNWFEITVEHMACRFCMRIEAWRLALTAGTDGFWLCVVAGSLDVHERKAQRSYWEEHSGELTLEAMMLDSRAAELDKEERPEVIYPATIFFTRLF